ncbi:MAG: hypothetical protein PHE65_06245, partial [Candidatus Omnitrophica bacterium]|nr:hypothetical protein [Candidatus Omnitrophota bacterium]
MEGKVSRDLKGAPAVTIGKGLKGTLGEVVRTNPNSLEVTVLGVLTKFKAKTLMTATTELITRYGALQAIKSARAEGFVRFREGAINELRGGEIKTGSIESLARSIAENGVDRLVVIGQEANISRGYTEQLFMKATDRSGKAVDVFIQRGDYFYAYKNGKQVPIVNVTISGTRQAASEKTKVIIDVLKEARSKGSKISFSVNAKTGAVKIRLDSGRMTVSDFKTILNVQILANAKANGNMGYKAIVLLDQSGVTGLDLKSAFAIPVDVKGACTTLRSYFGAKGTNIFAPGVAEKISRKGLPAEISKALDVYLKYKDTSAKFIGLFTRDSNMTLVEQTLGRDRGFGELDNAGNPEFGYHQKEVWVADQSVSGIKSFGSAKAFERLIRGNLEKVLRESLVNSINDSVKESMVERFKTLLDITPSARDAKVLQEIRTDFQSHTSVNTNLVSTEKQAEAMTMKEAIESDLRGNMFKFRESVNKFKHKLSAETRARLEAWVSSDMKHLDRRGNLTLKLENKRGSIESVSVKDAFARMSVDEIINEIRTKMPEAELRYRIDSRGTSQRAGFLEQAKREINALNPGAKISDAKLRDVIDEVMTSGTDLGARKWSDFLRNYIPAGKKGNAAFTAALGAIDNSFASADTVPDASQIAGAISATQGLTLDDKALLARYAVLSHISSLAKALSVNTGLGEVYSAAKAYTSLDSGIMGFAFRSLSPSMNVNTAKAVMNMIEATGDIQRAGWSDNIDMPSLDEALDFASAENRYGYMNFISSAVENTPGGKMPSVLGRIKKASERQARSEKAEKEYVQARIAGRGVMSVWKAVLMLGTRMMAGLSGHNVMNMTLASLSRDATKAGITLPTLITLEDPAAIRRTDSAGVNEAVEAIENASGTLKADLGARISISQVMDIARARDKGRVLGDILAGTVSRGKNAAERLESGTRRAAELMKRTGATPQQLVDAGLISKAEAVSVRETGYKPGYIVRNAVKVNQAAIGTWRGMNGMVKAALVAGVIIGAAAVGIASFGITLVGGVRTLGLVATLLSAMFGNKIKDKMTENIMQTGKKPSKLQTFMLKHNKPVYMVTAALGMFSWKLSIPILVGMAVAKAANKITGRAFNRSVERADIMSIARDVDAAASGDKGLTVRTADKLAAKLAERTGVDAASAKEIIYQMINPSFTASTVEAVETAWHGKVSPYKTSAVPDARVLRQGFGLESLPVVTVNNIINAAKELADNGITPETITFADFAAIARKYEVKDEGDLVALALAIGIVIPVYVDAPERNKRVDKIVSAKTAAAQMAERIIGASVLFRKIALIDDTFGTSLASRVPMADLLELSGSYADWALADHLVNRYGDSMPDNLKVLLINATETASRGTGLTNVTVLARIAANEQIAGALDAGMASKLDVERFESVITAIVAIFSPSGLTTDTVNAFIARAKRYVSNVCVAEGREWLGMADTAVTEKRSGDVKFALGEARNAFRAADRFSKGAFTNASKASMSYITGLDHMNRGNFTQARAAFARADRYNVDPVVARNIAMTRNRMLKDEGIALQQKFRAAKLDGYRNMDLSRLRVAEKLLNGAIKALTAYLESSPSPDVPVKKRIKGLTEERAVLMAQLGMAEIQAGIASERRGDREMALGAYRRGLASLDKLLRDKPGRISGVAFYYVIAKAKIAAAYRKSADYSRARRHFDGALKVAEKQRVFILRNGNKVPGDIRKTMIDQLRRALTAVNETQEAIRALSDMLSKGGDGTLTAADTDSGVPASGEARPPKFPDLVNMSNIVSFMGTGAIVPGIVNIYRVARWAIKRLVFEINRRVIEGRGTATAPALGLVPGVAIDMAARISGETRAAIRAEVGESVYNEIPEEAIRDAIDRKSDAFSGTVRSDIVYVFDVEGTVRTFGGADAAGIDPSVEDISAYVGRNLSDVMVDKLGISPETAGEYNGVYEVGGSFVRQADGTIIHRPSTRAITVIRGGKIARMGETDTVTAQDDAIFLYHIHPHIVAEFDEYAGDILAVVERSMVYKNGAYVPMVIYEMDVESGKIEVRRLSVKGNGFILEKLGPDGAFSTITELMLMLGDFNLDSLAEGIVRVPEVLGETLRVEQGVGELTVTMSGDDLYEVTRLTSLLSLNAGTPDITRSVSFETEALRRMISEAVLPSLGEEGAMPIARSVTAMGTLPPLVRNMPDSAEFLGTFASSTGMPVEPIIQLILNALNIVRSSRGRDNAEAMFRAVMELAVRSGEKVGTTESVTGESADMGIDTREVYTVLKQMMDLMAALEQGKAFTAPLFTGVDARSGSLDSEAVLRQLTAQAGMRGADKDKVLVQPVVVVDNGDPQGLAEKLSGSGVHVVEIADDENVIQALNRGVSERCAELNVKYNPSYVAMAVTQRDIDTVGDYSGSLSADERNNFLVINAEGLEGDTKQEVEDMVPTMNLMSILVRLATKRTPTLMAIGCDDNLLSRLNAMFRIVRVSPLNIGEEVRNFINAVIKTAVSA